MEWAIAICLVVVVVVVGALAVVTLGLLGLIYKRFPRSELDQATIIATNIVTAYHAGTEDAGLSRIGADIKDSQVELRMARSAREAADRLYPNTDPPPGSDDSVTVGIYGNVPMPSAGEL